MKKTLVLLFLILISSNLLSCSEDKTKTSALTLSVIQNIVIDLGHPRSDYLDTLGKYFGINRDQATRVIEYVDTIRLISEIEIEAFQDMQSSISEIDKIKPEEKNDFFISNILTPYLTFLSTTNPIIKGEHQNVYDSFLKTFSLDSSQNYLRSITRTTTNYHSDGVFNVDSLNHLNSILQQHGYFATYDVYPQKACIYKIDKRILDKHTRNGDTLSVLLLKRFTPCLLTRTLGYASVKSKFVVVTSDHIQWNSKEVLEEVRNHQSAGRYLSTQYEKTWKELGLDLNFLKANKLIHLLSLHDFQNQTDSEVYTKLYTETAIHEAKHLLDEYDNPRQNLNYDCEASAHLTEIIYSESPFNSLRHAISRMEGFYMASGEQRIGALVFKLWNLAIELEHNSFDEDHLRNNVIKIYNEYQTKPNFEHLPPLEGFQAVSGQIKLNIK
jgi:hypothetical protein